MKGMKRITTLLLAGSMALTFSACVRNDRIDTDGSDIEESSEEITGTSEEVLKWCESDHFYLYGHEIILGETTVQELYDITDCCEFWDFDETYTYRIYYTIDDLVDIPSCWLYPSEKAKESQAASAYLYIQRPEGYFHQDYPLKEGIIYGISFKPNTASLWGNNISFDVPLVMTPEELIENSGEPNLCEYGMYGYRAGGKKYEDHMFEFDEKGRLVEFTIQKITWG